MHRRALLAARHRRGEASCGDIAKLPKLIGKPRNSADHECEPRAKQSVLRLRKMAAEPSAVTGFRVLSGFFRVEPDELGVVLRFGQFVREVPPGLSYHLPYPIESALTPQALRVNKIDIGFDLRPGSTMRDVPEESLMLTGDENIVDVNFSVLWKVKPDHVGDFLFNVQAPEGTVKAVGESAMREVIGRSNIQAILTGARQTIETAVQESMQKTLDDYGAGVL